MNNFRIFTESKADIKFLKDYIKEVFNHDLEDGYFDPLGSWSGYKAGGQLNTSIQQNFDDGKKTILILDADNDFEKRKNEVLTDFMNYKIPINLFLFPNNIDNGNLETLLAQVAVERKLIDCFETYEKCITGYQLPANKSKIFAYLDALLPPKNKKNDKHDLIQEANRNYANKAHWDLNHDYLLPLNQFLASYL